MNKIIGHLKTITKHKILVTKLCFKCGLYKQGLLHDLSKYSYIELKTGFKYYQGFRSPIEKEKEEKGYSLGWLHHKGKNKHHWEYWLDTNKQKGFFALEMPINYVIEMFCDRVAASMNYMKDQYNDTCPKNYYENSKYMIMLHPNTKYLIEYLLDYLSKYGLEKTINFIKNNVLSATKYDDIKYE